MPEWCVGDLAWFTYHGTIGSPRPVVIKALGRSLDWDCEVQPDGKWDVAPFGARFRELTRRFPSELHQAVFEVVHVEER